MTSHRDRPVWRALFSSNDDEDDAIVRVDRIIFRGTVLLMLALGASSPIFRHDAEAYFVSGACIAVLTVLAGIAVFRRKPK